jgi:hypothetical protein
MEHLYRLHTGFVVVFLVFVCAFVLAHLWKRES